MKNSSYAASLLALVAALGATAARADGSEGGAYGGLSIGRVHNGSDSPVAPTDRNDSNYKLYGGYGFTPNFSVEYGYASLGRFNTANGSLKASGVFADAVGRWSLAPQWSAIGRVGLFNGSLRNADSLNGDAKDRGTNLKLGAGLQYDLSKNVSLRGEWERYKLDTSVGKPALDNYTLGVQLRF